MKTFITLMFLGIAPATFASASWKLTCTSESGISFYNDNGLAEIQFTSVNNEGGITNTKMDVAVENYDLGFEVKPASIKWLEKQKIISDTYEESCNGGHILTDFSQQVEITREDTKSSQIIEVICREETITGSAGDGEECSNEEI